MDFSRNSGTKNSWGLEALEGWEFKMPPKARQKL